MAYDVIVIGAGANGLTTAALLARAGRKVLVLERRECVGGLATPLEIHPGYRTPGALHDSSGLRPAVVRELRLAEHGLRLRRSAPRVLALGAGGRLLLPDDPAGAAAALGGPDAAAYAEYAGFSERVRPVLQRFVDEPPIDPVDPESVGAKELLTRALQLRRLGRRDMMELLRVAPMSLADRLDECFASDLLKLSLALPAMPGLFTGPRAPGSNLNRMLWEAAAGPGVAGGGPALIAALEAAARKQGAQLRVEAPVRRILLDADGVRAVVLQDGEEIAASTVAASCDPLQLFFRMLPVATLTRRLDRRLRSYRARGTMALLLLALDRPPRFAGGEDDPVEHARIGDGLDALERSYDALKYRTLPEAPVLDLHVPGGDALEFYPEGHAVVSIQIHGVPHDLEPEWSDAARERLTATTLGLVERHVPDLTRSLVARRLLTPVDLEQELALPRGNLTHGEPALDQLLVRPAPECNRYATPVAGLFLCGSGAHPGMALTCAPGLHAARAVLSGRRKPAATRG